HGAREDHGAAGKGADARVRAGATAAPGERLAMAIGWALHGPGRHASRSVIPQMRKAADTRLVAVISRDRARGAEFAKQHGFERTYASLEEALRDADIQAIYDATPDGLHGQNAIAAAQAGR